MDARWAQLSWTLVRVVFGFSIAFFHGYPKVFGGGVNGLANTVANLGFPAPTFFAWAAALSELVGGALVMLGLGTRIAASLVACTMAVALYRHLPDPLAKMELAALYFTGMIALALRGGGAFSLDAWFQLRLPVQRRG